MKVYIVFDYDEYMCDSYCDGKILGVYLQKKDAEDMKASYESRGDIRIIEEDVIE